MNKFFLSNLFLLVGVLLLGIATFPDYEFLEFTGWIVVGSSNTLLFEIIFKYLQEVKS